MTKLHDLYVAHDAVWEEMGVENEVRFKARRENGGSGPIPSSPESEDIRRRYDEIRTKIRAHGEQDMEPLLSGLKDRMADRAFAEDVYRSLSNVSWQHDDGSRWSTTWRSAGGIVAEIRNVGEDYMDFYCSGGEGEINDEVAEYLAGHGWHGDDS